MVGLGGMESVRAAGGGDSPFTLHQLRGGFPALWHWALNTARCLKH